MNIEYEVLGMKWKSLVYCINKDSNTYIYIHRYTNE